MKHVTIKDVAKKLNVSISTISRAFNDRYDIKPETRDYILKVAKEMGYFPNPIARKLSQNKTFNIGVVVPEFMSEFYSETIIGIQEVFIANGYQVVIMQCNEEPDLELDNVKTLVHNMVDGLILSPTTNNENMEYYENLAKQGYPLVFLSRVEPSFPASKVLFNNMKWSFFATEHLIRQNYKKIYYLCGHKNLSLTNDRISGFLKAMNKHKIAKENYKIIETGMTAEEGIEVIEDLIFKHDLPEAFFCFNDLVALGVMSKLKSNDIRVPEDIAIMGFTETKMSELVTPKLSSIKQPTTKMGKKAAELLLKQLKNNQIEVKTEPETIILNGELNIRESSIKDKPNK